LHNRLHLRLRSLACSEASNRDAVQAGAINAWIANCPVVLPDIVAICLKAVVQASGSQRHSTGSSAFRCRAARLHLGPHRWR